MEFLLLLGQGGEVLGHVASFLETMDPTFASWNPAILLYIILEVKKEKKSTHSAVLNRWIYSCGWIFHSIKMFLCVGPPTSCDLASFLF